ncbi:unnamed protein product [Paramecium pentaurelia]|uniref:CARD domain-containing protein n=1 Tax=Paramecium pentaurelia TaxID=43138 RepID=A0A8S1WC12_9CILI|nr:unnamed protein product [Paramecium pentaurelia]
MQSYTIKQLLLDIAEVIDNEIIDTYEQINKISLKEISEQSEKQQYDNILQIIAYLNRVKNVFEEQLEEHLNNDYETVIQKLEASIRIHIRVEQQQKLQIDALIQKIDEITIEKDIIIQQQQEKIKSQEQVIKDQHKKLFDSSPKEILHKKTPSAFERLSKLVSNKSQKSLQNSNNEANFKALLKICNTEKDRSLSKGRKQVSLKQEGGYQKTNDETQNLEPKLTETERPKDSKGEKRHRLQKSEKLNEQSQQSLSTDKQNKYNKAIKKESPLIRQEQTLSSQSFDQVGKSLQALQRQISNTRLQNNQSQQLLKFLQKK